MSDNSISLICQNPNCSNKSKAEIELSAFPKAVKCQSCNCIMVAHSIPNKEIVSQSYTTTISKKK